MTRRMVPQEIRVAVVDDDGETHLLVEQALRGAAAISCVGCYVNAAEALVHLPKLRPHLVLVAIHLPDSRGGQCLSDFKRILRVKIILIVRLPEVTLMDVTLWAGADGYLLKPANAEQCLAAIKFAGVCRRRGGGAQPTGNRASCRANPRLTVRENELMERFAEGLLYKEIADKLGMSYATVHKLQHKIFLKLEAHNRMEAVSRWRGENERCG